MIDKFTYKALAQGYKARSVYKLQDLDNKFKLIRKGLKILDLGAWPGSWCQYCLEKEAIIDAIDTKEVKLEGINFIKKNIFDEDIFDVLGTYDLVISDLAPQTTGIKRLDHEASFDLSMRSLEIAAKVLKQNGNYVCKIFQSEFSNNFSIAVKKRFRNVRTIKPVGSKKRSNEIYLIGLRKI